eukprot:CAMPEP_0167748842 /NCGR_PEP_ID=MMETSP0110_2-20121227/5064_1 /TAXON_ID=629695 /ORGANISM="Gymnochlora sp., Strain CCMP2014" /LENGTH=542 /DNA_ID=CAMNT_0007633905 /DNA_START=403 /DNA_END=2031 /DNA_ORIENTATION=-
MFQDTQAILDKKKKWKAPEYSVQNHCLLSSFNSKPLYLRFSPGALIVRFLAVTTFGFKRKIEPIYGYSLEPENMMRERHSYELKDEETKEGKGALMCFLSVPPREILASRGSKRENEDKHRSINGWILKGASIIDIDKSADARAYIPIFYRPEEKEVPSDNLEDNVESRKVVCGLKCNYPSEELEFLYATPLGKTLSYETLDADWLADSTLSIKYLQNHFWSDGWDDIGTNDYGDWKRIADRILPVDATEDGDKNEIRYWASFLFGHRRRIKPVRGPELSIFLPLVTFAKTVEDEEERKACTEIALSIAEIEEDLWGEVTLFAQYIYYHKGLILEEKEVCGMLGWHTLMDSSSILRKLQIIREEIQEFLHEYKIYVLENPTREEKNKEGDIEKSSSGSDREKTCAIRERLIKQRSRAKGRLSTYLKYVKKAAEAQKKYLESFDASITDRRQRFANFDLEDILACEERKLQNNQEKSISSVHKGKSDSNSSISRISGSPAISYVAPLDTPEDYMHSDASDSIGRRSRMPPLPGQATRGRVGSI